MPHENLPGRAHDLRLIADPAELWASMERDLDAATRRAWVAAYIYRDDVLGRSFADRLAAAARRGADVRLIYDPLGSRGTPDAFFDALGSRGIDAVPYRPLRVAFRTGELGPREHARVVLLDDVAYTGGINWGAEWLPVERGGEGWHDVSVRAVGPVTEDFGIVFGQHWTQARSRAVTWTDYASGSRHRDVELVADAPRHHSLVYDRLRERIRSSTRRVWIENAYCVPPPPLLDDLAAAAARGVDVQLVLPSRTDIPAVRWTARGEYAGWIGRGIGVNEYRPAVLHSKIAVIDDDWCTVGTFNAIAPGMYFSNEINLIVTEPGFVGQVARQLETDLARSEPQSAASLGERSLLARIRDGAFSRLFRALEPAFLPASDAHRGTRIA